MVYIYVLQLEKNKYYIGKTINPSLRLEKHFTIGGSIWTKKYKPITVIELIPDCDDYDEDKYTIKYMEKYGVENVRGGSFCEIKLSNDNIMTLNKMIKSVSNKCYICGKNDHFANDCKKCNCPTSYFSSHRKSKCLLSKMTSYFDVKNEIDEII